MAFSQTFSLRLVAAFAAAMFAFAFAASAAFAAPPADQDPSNGDAPDTKATTIHGAPQNNPAFDGDDCAGDANPGVGGDCGAEDVHNIQAGAPGKDGQSAAGGNEPPACTMHGGLGAGTTGTPCD